MPPTRPLTDPSAGVRTRLRRFGSAFVAGVAVGVVGLGVGALRSGTVRAASDVVFALGALALGLGVLGWAGSILAGDGVESMRRHLDVSADWTERGSRRAMARVSGFGAGVMAGVVVATTVWAAIAG
ncbi:DUF7268 family protein [Halegenticoccus tardaugens]|uniref:DUF7268 family protein n=1 Tax=Halegenticoccus tardaugens TaxID=2071624 RepID=UPI001E59FE05|nr:hypothetical protein [Halegenticoccus tardaugens]